MKNANNINTVAVSAISSPFEEQLFIKGTQTLAKLGVTLQYSDNIFKKTGFTVGTPEQRACDILNNICNEQIQGIFFARGGYGASQILPLIDKKNIRDYLNNKTIMGYSDVTSLFCYLYSKYSKQCIYGPNICSQYFNNKKLIKKVLEGKLGTHQKIRILNKKSGNIKAPVFGGCLSVLTSMVGTPYLRNLKDHILFIEDTNEAPYKIDRMLTQLTQSGLIKGIKAIAVGAMEKCDSPKITWKDTIANTADKLKIPAIYGIKAGHAGFDSIIKLGAIASIDMNKKEFEIKD